MDVAPNTCIGPQTSTWLLEGEALSHRLLAIERFNLPLRFSLMQSCGEERRHTRRPQHLSPGAGLRRSSAVLAGGVSIAGQPAELGCPAHLFARRSGPARAAGSATLAFPMPGTPSGASANVRPRGDPSAPSKRHPSR